MIRSVLSFFSHTTILKEGGGLFTLMHKGCVIVMLRHPVLVAEELYLDYYSNRRTAPHNADEHSLLLLHDAENGGGHFMMGRVADVMTTLATGAAADGYTVQDLLHCVNSTKYYDNRFTRMCVNIPPHIQVTDKHFCDT